jgi:hypothetical protein
MEWEGGLLVSAQVMSKLGNQLNIKYGDITSVFETNPDQVLLLDHQIRKD